MQKSHGVKTKSPKKIEKLRVLEDLVFHEKVLITSGCNKRLEICANNWSHSKKRTLNSTLTTRLSAQKMNS